MKKIKRNILLNPGPATTTNRVKLAQVVPDICPREKEFGDLMQTISTGLTKVVVSKKSLKDYTTVLFACSGTGAVESVLTSVVESNKKILIINNGSYGARMVQIAKSYKLDYIEYKSSKVEPIDYKNLEKTISKNSKIGYIAMVHNETTTGLLNSIKIVGKISKKYSIDLIVDGMSSYGAIPINMKKDNISYLVASSNKNIQGMAGVGFVVSNISRLNSTKNIDANNFYFNLYAQYLNFINSHQMRFTPPVQTLYALQEAIDEANEEGIKNRYKRYSKSWKTLTKGLKILGLKYLVDDNYHSKIITSIFIPNGVNFDALHDYFYSKDITIYPGKVDEFNTFRVANIGQIDYKDIKLFLKLLKKYLKK